MIVAVGFAPKKTLYILVELHPDSKITVYVIWYIPFDV